MQCFSFPFMAMGSSCEIKLYAGSQRIAAEAAQHIINTVNGLEQRYSRYIRGNTLYEINEAAQNAGSIRVDDETAALLNYAESCYQNSDGLFDITSGVLREAWNFKSGVLPEQEHINRLLTSVGWEKVDWQGPRLAFHVAGMELDFGGIVKEYAADRCAAQCLENGFVHGLINLGGDIRIIGPHANGEAWSIGIRNPRDKQRHISEVHIKNGAICSSGDYERCIKIGGRYYSHILNPKTGWPTRGLASVSVIAELCLVAGSISTIAMLKERDGKSWLKANALPAVWIDEKARLGKTGI